MVLIKASGTKQSRSGEETKKTLRLILSKLRQKSAPVPNVAVDDNPKWAKR
jgi:hypothetical protein